MRTRLASLAAIPLLSFAALPIFAADPAPAPAVATPASGAADRAHIDAAVTFLKALSHTARKGDQSGAAWTELHTVTGDKVPVTIAGAHHDLDVAGMTGDAKLVSFSKIASYRDGKDVKGVTVGALDFKIGADDHKGAGKLLMTQTDGKWTVTAVEVE